MYALVLHYTDCLGCRSECGHFLPSRPQRRQRGLTVLSGGTEIQSDLNIWTEQGINRESYFQTLPSCQLWVAAPFCLVPTLLRLFKNSTSSCLMQPSQLSEQTEHTFTFPTCSLNKKNPITNTLTNYITSIGTSWPHWDAFRLLWSMSDRHNASASDDFRGDPFLQLILFSTFSRYKIMIIIFGRIIWCNCGMIEPTNTA